MKPRGRATTSRAAHARPDRSALRAPGAGQRGPSCAARRGAGHDRGVVELRDRRVEGGRDAGAVSASRTRRGRPQPQRTPCGGGGPDRRGDRVRAGPGRGLTPDSLGRARSARSFRHDPRAQTIDDGARSSEAGGTFPRVTAQGLKPRARASPGAWVILRHTRPRLRVLPTRQFHGQALLGWLQGLLILRPDSRPRPGRTPDAHSRSGAPRRTRTPAPTTGGTGASPEPFAAHRRDQA